MTRRVLSPAWGVLVCAFWMAAAGNVPLWRKFEALGLMQSTAGVLFVAAMLVFIFGILALLLGLLAWRRTFKGVAIGLMLVTAFSSYFMLSYGVVIDPGMVTNTVQTDVHEATALFSWQLVVVVAVLALLPGWLLWRQPMAYGSLRRQLGRNLLLVALGVLLAVAAVFTSFQTLASVMRNHKDLRYLMNPLAAMYSAARVAIHPFERDDRVLVRTGEDATLAGFVAARSRPPILLLVLGETGRSGNFSINGYERPTTPELQREGAVSFSNAWSCGTSTAASVPCMYSDLGREHFEDRKSQHEGLLDVLQRAGLAVLWVDNQSGCKGVCDRVPSVSTTSNKTSPLCASGECLDGVMLEDLDARIAALDPQRVARGLVLVLHQMGSHGPAYHLRSPQDLKRFQPECSSAALHDCSREALVNAYDNSIAYTDHFLGQAITWLKSKSGRADTALIYVADHGESLGENNLYLHGMPYAVAPDVQKHVPWITWVSEGFQHSAGLSLDCLRKTQDRSISHDNYFHSVLGFMNVETRAYRPLLDVYAGCRDQPDAVALAMVRGMTRQGPDSR